MPISQPWVFVALLAGTVSVGVAIWLYGWVNRQDAGSEKAQEVASWIRDGARSYLRRLYLALTLVAVALGVIIAVVFSFDIEHLGTEAVAVNPSRGITMALAFVAGAICSALAGYMGMSVAVSANVRSAAAANESINRAFKVAFYAGAVMGLAMVGLAVIGMGAIYLMTGDPEIILGFSFGASALALLAKAGGGIYTKTADIAADLVGKVEIGIPEDDPRNPAVVADNVGDNVGDVAGMGADIFDSYVASTVAAMLLGASLFASDLQDKYVVLPLIVCTLGIVASLIGIRFVRVGKSGDLCRVGYCRRVVGWLQSRRVVGHAGWARDRRRHRLYLRLLHVVRFPPGDRDGPRLEFRGGHQHYHRLQLRADQHRSLGRGYRRGDAAGLLPGGTVRYKWCLWNRHQRGGDVGRQRHDRFL